MAFDRLSHDFGMTQEQIAERTGKNRSTISNSLRLLRLDPQVKKMIGEGLISASHARALMTITDPPRKSTPPKKPPAAASPSARSSA